MPTGDEPQELQPSTKPLAVDATGPCRPPEISNSCGIPLPDILKILEDKQ